MPETPADAHPAGGLPLIVCFVPEQLDEVFTRAEDEGLEPATIVRRAVRLYLASQVETDDAAAARAG